MSNLGRRYSDTQAFFMIKNRYQTLAQQITKSTNNQQTNQPTHSAVGTEGKIGRSTTTVRRFFCRPSGVSLEVTG